MYIHCVFGDPAPGARRQKRFLISQSPDQLREEVPIQGHSFQTWLASCAMTVLTPSKSRFRLLKVKVGIAPTDLNIVWVIHDTDGLSGLVRNFLY